MFVNGEEGGIGAALAKLPSTLPMDPEEKKDACAARRDQMIGSARVTETRSFQFLARDMSPDLLEG